MQWAPRAASKSEVAALIESCLWKTMKPLTQKLWDQLRNHGFLKYNTFVFLFIPLPLRFACLQSNPYTVSAAQASPSHCCRSSDCKKSCRYSEFTMKWLLFPLMIFCINYALLLRGAIWNFYQAIIESGRCVKQLLISFLRHKMGSSWWLDLWYAVEDDI